MSLLLDGKDRAELRKILLDGFDRKELDLALREASPAHDFEDIVSDSAFRNQVAELIDSAESAGWLGQFQRILQDALPGREDLHARLKTVLDEAAKRGRGIGPDPDPPGIALRSRLLGFAGAGAALGLGGAVLGIVAWICDTTGNPWPLALGIVSLFFGALFGVLFASTLIKDRIGDRGLAFLRSKLPLVAMAGLAALAAVNGYLTVNLCQNDRPNFILQLVDQEKNKQIANQPVHLVELASTGEDDGQRMDRITDINGQAFFKVQLGSGFLYTGGAKISEGERTRTCAFPAFVALEARSIVQDVAALNCIDSAISTRGTPGIDEILRVTNVFASTATLPVEVKSRLPRSTDKRAERAPLGTPDAPLILDRSFYSLGYDPSRRAPIWAAYAVSGSRPRTVQPQSLQQRYIPDPDLPRRNLSGDADYQDNPYSRGPLIPAVDAAVAGATGMTESLYYSATVPLAGNVRKSSWLELTNMLRDRAAPGGPTYVTTGPIYHPRLVIGPGQTQVPIALFQVLLKRDGAGKWRAAGFIVNNDGSIGEVVPKKLLVTVAEIERRTGLTFFPNLPPSQAASLKSDSDIKMFLP